MVGCPTVCYGVFGGKGTVDTFRGRNGRFMRLNLSSSTLYLLGVLFSILFLALIFLLCLIIVISILDVILSMYTPSVLGAFDLWNIVIYHTQKKKKKKNFDQNWTIKITLIQISTSFRLQYKHAPKLPSFTVECITICWFKIKQPAQAYFPRS